LGQVATPADEGPTGAMLQWISRRCGIEHFCRRAPDDHRGWPGLDGGIEAARGMPRRSSS